MKTQLQQNPHSFAACTPWTSSTGEAWRAVKSGQGRDYFFKKQKNIENILVVRKPSFRLVCHYVGQYSVFQTHSILRTSGFLCPHSQKGVLSYDITCTSKIIPAILLKTAMKKMQISLPWIQAMPTMRSADCTLPHLHGNYQRLVLVATDRKLARDTLLWINTCFQ